MKKSPRAQFLALMTQDATFKFRAPWCPIETVRTVLKKRSKDWILSDPKGRLRDDGKPLGIYLDFPKASEIQVSQDGTQFTISGQLHYRFQTPEESAVGPWEVSDATPREKSHADKLVDEANCTTVSIQRRQCAIGGLALIMGGNSEYGPPSPEMTLTSETVKTLTAVDAGSRDERRRVLAIEHALREAFLRNV